MKNVLFFNNFFLDVDLFGFEVRETTVLIEGLKFVNNIFDASTLMTDRTLPTGEEFPKIYLEVKNLRMENNVMMTSELFLFR